MKKYCVRLIKYKTYYIDAENMDQAENAAFAYWEEKDPDAWLDHPIDEIEVEEVKMNERQMKV